MNIPPKTSITLMDTGRLAVVFPYSDEIVARIRGLSDRKWNAAHRRWEVSIAHLPELLDILRLDPATMDRKIMRAFQVYKIRHGRAKIVANNVEAVISGGSLPLEKIDRLCSFFLPGYKYMARFKKGTWDGKKHLFHTRGNRFPSGLVNRVCKIVRDSGMECDVIWPEEPPRQDLSFLVGPIGKTAPKAAKSSPRKQKHDSAETSGAHLPAPVTKLRDYQKKCLEAALTERRGIIEIATGGGKTLIAAHIIHALSRPALFLVHTRDLLYQTIEVLERELGIPVGYAGDGKINIKPVTVATVQTCARAMDIKLDSAPDGEHLASDKPPPQTAADQLRDFIKTVPVAIFDECHHLPTETAYGLAHVMHGAFWRFGLSATPYRADRQDMLMEAALGPKIFSARASTLIEKGYLVPPRIRFLPVPPLILKSGTVEYSELYSCYVVENRRRNKLVVDAAQEQASMGNTVLILVTHVRHGEVLRDLLGGVPLLQGSDAPEERRRVFAALQEKSCPIAIATTLADEGLDIPSLNCVVVASAGRSETRVLQRIGRALRPFPGKECAVIIDFMDDAPYLREHASDRLELYKTESRFILEN
jgi:superfamily II DNA or RNA helicase